MSCTYCRSTPVNPCPVCTVAPIPSQTIRKAPKTRARVNSRGQGPVLSPSTAKPLPPVPKAAPVAPKAAPVAPKAAPVAPKPIEVSARDARLAEECAMAWGARKYRFATALLCEMADEDKRADRVCVLLLIDENASLRKFEQEKDQDLLKSIGTAALTECKARLGFDPRHPAKLAIKVPEVKAAPVATPTPVVVPVADSVSDAEVTRLQTEINAGRLTPQEAGAVADLWSNFDQWLPRKAQA